MNGSEKEKERKKERKRARERKKRNYYLFIIDLEFSYVCRYFVIFFLLHENCEEGELASLGF